MLQDNGANGNTTTAYWDEWSSKIIEVLGLKKISNEWHGSCPNCGGKDRFWITEYHGEVKVNCRQCEDWKAINEILTKQGLLPEWKPMQKEEKVVKLPEPTELHPYLTQKRIKLHNAKIDENDIHITIINNKGERVGTQFIEQDGKKRFSFQMPVTGNFAVVGGKIEDFAYLCEGHATACSVFEATGKPAVHCLSAGNIVAVCKALQEVKPNARLVIAGDNDEAGRKACEKAFIECGVEHILPPNEGQDWNDVWCTKGAEATKKLLQPVNVLDEVIFPDQAIAQTQQTYIIKEWLTENTISVVYGASNVGKSFFAMDLSWHVAANQVWMGCKVRGGAVLYLATEGGLSFANRLVALREKYPDHENVKLAIRPSPINLFNAAEDIAKVEALIAAISKKHGQVRMLVIDTLARATQGQMDENNNSEASKFIKQLDAIRERTGVHIMLIGHSGKDTNKGLRGASSIKAAADSEIELTQDEGSKVRTAKTTKQRDMETGRELHFILERILLGQDVDGDEVSTCVIREATKDEMDDVEKPKLKGKNQKLFKQVFFQLRGEGIGSPNPVGAGWPNARQFWCIDEALLQDHFIGKLVGAARPQQTWKQTLDLLLSNGHIAANQGKIWLCGKDGKVSDSEKEAPF